MLLIIFFGLIAKLTSVSGDCLFGTEGVKNLDYTKVCVSVLRRFLKKKQLFKLLVVFYMLFVFPLTTTK